MPLALNLSQFLPGALLVAGVVLLSLFLVMNIRHKIARRAAASDPRKFIHDIREQAQAGIFPAHVQKATRPARPRSTAIDQRSVASAEHQIDPANPAKDTEPRGDDALDPAIRERHESDVATRAMRELDETARRVLAQLDTRIAIVEKIIRDADERLEMIRSLLDQAPGASISPSKLAALDGSDSTARNDESLNNSGSACKPSLHEAQFEDPWSTTARESRIGNPPLSGRIHSDDLVSDEAVEGADANGHRPTQNGHQQRASTNGRAAVSANQPEPSQMHAATEESRIRRQIDSLSASVYELADRGMSAVAIAQDLDEHVGKVELILALRSKAPTA